MTKSYSIDYGGKSYTLDGPDDATEDQIKAAVKARVGGDQSGNTRGGDLARGLLHGAESSVGMGGPTPEGASGWREAGEDIGGVVPSFVAGMIPGGKLVQGGIGATMGALQPASGLTERLENAAIGGGSALTGGQIGKYIANKRIPLNKLANEAIGSTLGFSHGGGWGSLGGLWAGRNIGHDVQQLFGGRGLADLVSYIASNPGLASYIGLKASPYAEQAGKIAGDELNKPSQ